MNDLPEEEYAQDDIGKDGREVHHLARRLDALDQGQADHGPRGQEAAHELPLQASQVAPVDALLVQVEHPGVEVVLWVVVIQWCRENSRQQNNDFST